MPFLAFSRVGKGPTALPMTPSSSLILPQIDVPILGQRMDGSTIFLVAVDLVVGRYGSPELCARQGHPRPVDADFAPRRKAFAGARKTVVGRQVRTGVGRHRLLGLAPVLRTLSAGQCFSKIHAGNGVQRDRDDRHTRSPACNSSSGARGQQPSGTLSLAWVTRQSPGTSPWPFLSYAGCQF
jgi:hypothetical protein